jgi:hypothetical protein
VPKNTLGNKQVCGVFSLPCVRGLFTECFFGSKTKFCQVFFARHLAHWLFAECPTKCTRPTPAEAYLACDNINAIRSSSEAGMHPHGQIIRVFVAVNFVHKKKT